MAKRKKHPKLPNGYGSIKYLGKGRRNPYAVHPPTTEFTLDGVPITPRAICYVDDWYKGFAILTAYKAGTYTPGMELGLEMGDTNHDTLTQVILASYNRMSHVQEPEMAFSDIYREFWDYKFERDKSRSYSVSARNAIKAAYKNAASLHNRAFASLRHKDLQSVLDGCPLKHSSVELIRSLFHQMYEYALINELVDKDYSAALKINKPDDDEHGVPFTDDELHILWQHKGDPTAEMLLIMCYSGFRIMAYRTIATDTAKWYFQGGVKTASGKGRIVPIHTAIRPLVQARLDRQGVILAETPGTFRKAMYAFLEHVGIARHTPHDCRHTFSSLCERYHVNENDRKRLLGHSFGSDITNGIYGHRLLDDLRAEIEKLEACY